ncbi:der [Scenedesmus sp. PABB004]|nr:der [Scenedesmus sp. PABB004]
MLHLRAALRCRGAPATAAAAAAARRAFARLPRLEDLPDAHLLPTVALVGRPNVGKSALFNRLVRKRDALVFDTPGGHVTRDYREGLGGLADLSFRVVDTSGLEPGAPAPTLQGRAAALTRGVLRGSSVVLMLLDARQGVVAADEALLAWLRVNSTAPLMLLANKADTAAGSSSERRAWGRAGRHGAAAAAPGRRARLPRRAAPRRAADLDQVQADLAGLGADPATPISATSGEGMADLYNLLRPIVDAAEQQRGRPPPARQPARGAAALPAREPAPAQQARDEAAAASTAAAAEEAEVERLVAEALAAQGSDSDADADAGDATRGAAATRSARAAAPDGGGGGGSQLQQQQDGEEDEGRSDEAAAAALGPLRLAILGLPNAGKSTLMNALLGYERSLTGPEPGLTRDPTTGWLRHGRLDVQLVDTAGWKRAGAAHPTQGPTAPPPAQAQAQAPQGGRGGDGNGGERPLAKQLADASLAQARRALGAAHVAVLLLDAPRLLEVGQAITRLELQLAGLALAQGKALVVGLNKADAVPGGARGAEALRERVTELLEARFLPAGRLPVLGLSALTGDGAAALLDAAVAAYAAWNRRVSSWRLRAALAKQSLRFYGSGGSGALLGRVKWAAQLKARPPTFVLLLRGADEVDEGGQRFLANVLRASLHLEGVPLRLYLRYNKRQRQPVAAARGPQRRGRRR